MTFASICRFCLGTILLGSVFAASAAPAAVTDSVVNVREAGATGDGRTLDNQAINRAMAALGAAGGGTLYFPPGTYHSGTIFLHSNVTLYLEAGATILGSLDYDDYPDVSTRLQGFEGVGYAALVFGKDLENVAIRGRGTIDGRGDQWWERGFAMRDFGRAGGDITTMLSARELRHRELNRGLGDSFARGSLVQFYECRNVLVEGVTLRNATRWTLHPIYCDNVTIHDVTIWNPPDSKNTDGINPDSCTNVRISNCHISTGDDCIAIKSGRDEDGRRVGRPSENITITNCTMLAGHGGVVIGSEMSGDVRNVVVSNCVFKGTKRGLRIKTQRGRGGVVENVFFSNIVMDGVLMAGIIIDMVYYDRTEGVPDVGEGTPTIRDIHFSNIVGTNLHTAFAIDGLPESPARNLTFSGLRLQAEQAGRIDHVHGLDIKDMQLRTESPEPWRLSNVKWGQGLFLRLTNPSTTAPLVRLHNVGEIALTQIQFESPTSRPVALAGSVEALDLATGARSIRIDRATHASDHLLDRSLNPLR